jgi:hypothetical protein
VTKSFPEYWLPLVAPEWRLDNIGLILSGECAAQIARLLIQAEEVRHALVRQELRETQ